MNVLVAYASRHGATAGIAERIAEDLRSGGLSAGAVPAKDVRDIGPYDALVIGGAAYMFHWAEDALAFALRAASGTIPIGSDDRTPEDLTLER
jgi:menaquinone-dependent protoporphyrinogen oxidase